MFKNVRTFAIAMLFPFSVAAFEPREDLKGSTAIAQGQCPYEGITYVCFIVKKDNNLYMVVVDNGGVLLVYTVTEVKRDYVGDEATLIWSRIPSRRKNDST